MKKKKTLFYSFCSHKSELELTEFVEWTLHPDLSVYCSAMALASENMKWANKQDAQEKNKRGRIKREGELREGEKREGKQQMGGKIEYSGRGRETRDAVGESRGEMTFQLSTNEVGQIEDNSDRERERDRDRKKERQRGEIEKNYSKQEEIYYLGQGRVRQKERTKLFRNVFIMEHNQRQHNLRRKYRKGEGQRETER